MNVDEIRDGEDGKRQGMQTEPCLGWIEPFDLRWVLK